MRREDGKRWNGKLIESMKGTPGQPDPNKPGDRIQIKVHFDDVDKDEIEDPEPLRQEMGIRRMRITPNMLERHGYTEGCEACRYKRAGINNSKGHSEECRKKQSWKQ